MTKITWVTIGLAAMAAVAGGCKPKATGDATPSASVAATTPAPATTAAAKADTPFEGEIQLAVYEPGSKTPQTIAYDVKGDAVRAQVVGGDASVARLVGNRKDKKVLEVVDASKSYASVALDPAADKTLPLVTRTGKMDHVLGRECENWTVSDGGERFDICAAKGIAYVDMAAGASKEPGWAAVLTLYDAFPLRVVATDKAGKQEFRAEATKIEARKLDDATFKVPAGYHTATLGKSTKIASIP